MRFTKGLGKVIRAANTLSLGISIVVAVILGVVIGYYLSKWTGVGAFLWIFTAFGVAAAGLNVYKAYKNLMKDAQKIENDPKYKNIKPADLDDEDDEKDY